MFDKISHLFVVLTLLLCNFCIALLSIFIFSVLYFFVIGLVGVWCKPQPLVIIIIINLHVIYIYTSNISSVRFRVTKFIEPDRGHCWFQEDSLLRHAKIRPYKQDYCIFNIWSDLVICPAISHCYLKKNKFCWSLSFPRTVSTLTFCALLLQSESAIM